MNQNHKLGLAVMIAPWTVLPIVVASTLTLGTSPTAGISDTIFWAFLYGAFAVAIAYACVIIYGIPAFLILRRLRIFGFWSALFAGLIGPAVILFPTGISRERIFFVLCGGFVAIVAWFIVGTSSTKSSNQALKDDALKDSARFS